MRLSLDRIRAATAVIAPVFLRSPQVECLALGSALGCRVTLKVETRNPIRSFKGRGTEVVAERTATNSDVKGLICASAGNLGQALAYSGRSWGLTATVVASDLANERKLDRIRELGARVILVPGDIELARSVAREMAALDHLFLVEDSENIDTCEGAATIGLELFEEETQFDSVLIALGGGAMATGVGFVCQQLSPTTNVICVQPTGAPAMTLSWRAGTVVETKTCDTIADGVAGRCPIPEVLEDLLQVADDALLVSESSIVQGMQLLKEHANLIVEPSAALGVAAILENRGRFKDRHVVTIICGGNA